MSRKLWGRLTLSLLIGVLVLITAVVAVIDPFEVYHRAERFIPPITNGTQNYSNAGIAKNYVYDSVIIGSSMTENFTPSLFDKELGGSFVKLPINGGSIFNNKQMMDLAFEGREIKTVVYGFDVEALTFFYKTPKCEMPDYLYDNDLFNDVRYWFNRSVLMTYIPRCLKTWGQTDPSLRDTMYCWGDLYPYGKEAALRGLKITDEIFEQEAPAEAPVLSQQSMLNVNYNLIPYIEAHPETRFIFFFPPYSVAGWYQFYRYGQLGYHLNQKEAAFAALKDYPNVEFYDFQARTDWITDLDNYIDLKHYGPWINDEMTHAMANGEYRVTSLEEVRANNEMIRTDVGAVVSAGCWPDEFPY